MGRFLLQARSNGVIMSRNWTLLPLILFLGSTGTLQAQPLDSPDVVYIDGQPCSRACQAYMNWSYRAQSARRHEEREISVAVPAEPEIERIEPVARPRAAKHAAPGCPPRAARRQGGVERQGAQRQGVEQQKDRRSQSSTSSAGHGGAAVTPERAVGETVAAIQKPEPKVESARAAGADSRHRRAAARRSTCVQGAVARGQARGEVEVVLPPPATLDVAAAPAAPAPGMASNKAKEIGKTASASPDDQDNLVALVLVRPEINSLSDLNNKNIAITEKQSASSGRVSAALMAAGAAEVQFSEAKASAIDRLMNGEVPAAVVLASREVANLFPEVEGFRTFRVPLKARM